MFGSTMRGIKRVKTSKGLLLQSKQLLMRNAWTRKGMASAMGNEEIQRQAFCQVTRLPAWLGNEWGEEPDKTLPAPFLRWVAEMCCIGMPQARLPSFLQLLCCTRFCETHDSRVPRADADKLAIMGA